MNWLLERKREREREREKERIFVVPQDRFSRHKGHTDQVSQNVAVATVQKSHKKSHITDRFGPASVKRAESRLRLSIIPCYLHNHVALLAERTVSNKRS